MTKGNVYKRPRLEIIQEYPAVQHRVNSALDVLPEEIWLLVLDCAQTVDINSVLQAFPELNSAFNARKTSWLLEQVLPYIFKQFHGLSENLRNCRQVSKRWRNSIDKFLESHPQQRPYNFRGISSRTVPYRDFSYEHLRTSEFLRIQTAQDIDNFLQNFKGNPKINPFVGRVVKLTRTETDDQVYDAAQLATAEQFLDSTTQFLKEFGHHIWYITLRFGNFPTNDSDVIERILGKIVSCLHLLSKLRSLRFGFDFEDCEILFDEAYYQALEIPELASLDTLQIVKGFAQHCSVTDLIIRLCCTNKTIRRLEIPLQFWKPRYKEYFSEVCEIFVNSTFAANYKTFPKILPHFPLVKKIHFKPSYTSKPIRILDLFRNLELLEIEELEILNCHESLKVVGPKQNEKCVDMPLPTIKYLRVYDTKQLRFEFLRALPSLEHLHLCRFDKDLRNVFMRRASRRSNGSSLTNLVRSYMYLPNVPENLDIWKELPSLKLITVDEGLSVKRFARECKNKMFRFS